MVNGITIGLFELFFWWLASFSFRMIWKELKKMDRISYYWLAMTIMTMIWKISFIIDYKRIVLISRILLKKKEHIWLNEYNVLNLLPWVIPRILYSEYGAYADREYMILSDDWSRVIEGTDAIFCGIFACAAIILKVQNNKSHYFAVAVSISMGSQLMNSILYISNYLNQLHNINSINYVDHNFPSTRPFMYVNIFWIIFPSYIILKLLYSNKIRKKLKPDRLKRCEQQEDGEIV